MEKSVPSAKKKFSIRDIMTIAAMMVICFMVTSPALMLLGAAITAVLTFLGTLFGQRLLRKHFQKAGIVG